MDGWKTSLSFWDCNFFRGELLNFQGGAIFQAIWRKWDRYTSRLTNVCGKLFTIDCSAFFIKTFITLQLIHNIYKNVCESLSKILNWGVPVCQGCVFGAFDGSPHLSLLFLNVPFHTKKHGNLKGTWILKGH